jgi:hypothetical protein
MLLTLGASHDETSVMTEEQFKQLRSMITMISDRVDQIEMHLRRQDEIANHRFNLVYQWCAPAQYKAIVDATSIDIPEDLKSFLA